MSERVPPLLEPKAIADRDFSSAFRGYDPTEVRSYLRQLADAAREVDASLRVAAKAAERPEPEADHSEHEARIQELEGVAAKLRAERDALVAKADLGGSADEVAEFRATIDSLRAKLADAEAVPAAPAELDEAALTRLLGAETVRVLDSARSAASEITARAQAEADERTSELDAYQAKTNAELTEQRKEADEYAAGLRSGADEYARSVRSEADTEVAALRSEVSAEIERLRSEADEDAATVRRQADEAAASVIEEADKHAEAARASAQEVATAVKARAEEVARETRLAAEADAESIRDEAGGIRSDAQAEAARIRAEAQADASTAADAAREEARQMVAEAQVVREKILDDLVKRRRNGRQQLDQVKAARDRMARALVAMQVHLDAAVEELDVSVPEARKAMEQAAKQVAVAGETAATSGDAEAGRRALAAVVNRSSVGSATPAADDTATDSDTAPAEDTATDNDGVVPDPVDDVAPDELDNLFARIRQERLDDDELGEPPLDSVDSVADESAGADETVGAAEAAGPAENTVAALLGAAPAAVEEPEPEVADDEPEIDPGPHFGARDVALTRHGAGLRRAMKRALADDQSDILDRLQQARGRFSVGDLASDTDQLERYRVAAGDGLQALATAGAKHAGARTKAAKEVRDVTDRLVDALVPSLRAKTEASIIAADGDVEEALEAVRAHYREARGNDLPELLDDAMMEAFAAGVYAAIPDGAPVEWITDPRVVASPDCHDNTFADDVAKPGEFPTGHSRPLGSPGCRCLVVARD
ncbi:MAG: DivIVA domain-containing protein [Acidimicrobiales bacterium]